MQFNLLNKPDEDIIMLSNEELEQLSENENNASHLSPEVLAAIKTELALRGWS
ncbi:MAG: hypothetical protein PHT62_00155 [Desulfotomaculaceae bacterium]|nr:hypothetical protein [Desulfotomaculaceae bacterium]